MAKQNFLNGGYIGKLGDTVGQRWKNLKIIRTYVKPANPNTPAQQTARQQFAVANKLAQEAMNMNGHTGVWDTSTKPEYSQRVGQAMRRLRLGYSEKDSLPLYPEGQAPAVNVIIQDVVFEQVSNSYRFTVNSFQIQNPVAAEITFYTPLNYGAGKYGENIIHATVDSVANTFTVDLSATNTADQQAVKTLFANAMELGFCAMTATFYDALGATLNNVSIQRKYQVADKLYDFDESLTLLDTTSKVSFTQAFTGNSLSGAIIAQSSAGFPLVSKVSVQATYYGGIAGETAESQFILQNANAPQIFTVPVAATAGNLQETVATTYTLTAGATRPQLYKDSSTAQYAQPISKANVTGITFAGNTMLLSIDQNATAAGAVSAQVSVSYGWVDTTGTFSVLSQTLTGTIAQGGTSVSITDAIVPRLAPAFVGSLSVDFKDNLGASITALNPDPVKEIAGKFYAAKYTTHSPYAIKAALLSGKSIGGTINVSLTDFEAYSAKAFLQAFAIVTYADGQTETLRGQELYDWGGAPASVAFTTTANANKEIRSAIITACTIDPSDTLGFYVASNVTVTIPSSVTTSVMTYGLGTRNITGSIPMTNIPFIKSVGGSVKAWEDADGALIESQLTRTPLPSTGVINLSATASSASAWDSGTPIIWKPALFYEDGTQCTTVNVSIPLPTATEEGMIIQESSWQETNITTLTANTSVVGKATFSSGGLPAIPAGSTVYGFSSTWTDTNDADLVEIENPSSSTGTQSVTFTATQIYIDAAATQVGMSGYLVFFWVAGNTVKIITMA